MCHLEFRESSESWRCKQHTQQYQHLFSVPADIYESLRDKLDKIMEIDKT